MSRTVWIILGAALMATPLLGQKTLAPPLGATEALVEAIMKADMTTARALVADGADVNARDRRINLPILMWALASYRSDIVRFLIDRGARVDARASGGETVLMWEANTYEPAVLNQLLNAGADVNARDQRGETPLDWALRFGRPKMAWTLLARGASVKASASGGGLALVEAAGPGYASLVQELLRRGAAVNAKLDHGGTALMAAAASGPDPACARALLQRHAEVNAKDDAGKTALMLAAREGFLETVKLLLASGAAAALQDRWGNTARDYAARRGQTAVVRWLDRARTTRRRVAIVGATVAMASGSLFLVSVDGSPQPRVESVRSDDGTRPAGILGTHLPARQAAAVARWAKPVPFPRQRLYPVDEGVKDRSFRAFRRELLRAAQRRDYRFLLGHLDPHIVVNPFGEPITGIKEFKEEWHPEDPKSDLWPELIRILSLGGSFKRGEVLGEGMAPEGREFVAPYVTSRWPDSLDADRYWAIVGKQVPVRRRPDAASPVVDVLSYDMVKVGLKDSLGPGDERWIEITTSRGKLGYVAVDRVRSAEDTVAHFAKKQGRWLLTGLFATFGE